ncbi:MAG: NTPase [Candidatus Bipolaricaulota bacterium]
MGRRTSAIMAERYAPRGGASPPPVEATIRSEERMRIAVTGNPGVGKSTLVLRVVEGIPISCGGLVTQEIRKCGRRVGFSLRDLATGQEGVLAHIHLPAGPGFGRYRINLRDLDEIGAAAIERAVEQRDLVVVDEVGPMELHSPRFIAAVDHALAQARNLLVTVHRASNHPLAYRIRRGVDHYLRLTRDNRDETAAQVIGFFLGVAG